MDTTDLFPLIQDLEGNIDDLEDSLEPLLKAALSESASKLPLLDKAKLYVLVVYTVESILFSYLRLNGVKAKEHPVFTELTRVKQYFEKIKLAEEGPQKRNVTLDKGAAGRFIKHGLAGNDKYDRERAERQAKEKAWAQAKLEQMKEHLEQERAAMKRKADDTDGLAKEEEETSTSGSEAESTPAESSARKKQKTISSASVAAGKSSEETTPRKKSKSEKRKAKRQSLIEREDPTKLEQATETIIPKGKKKSSKAPKGPKEAFQELLKKSKA